MAGRLSACTAQAGSPDGLFQRAVKDGIVHIFNLPYHGLERIVISNVIPKANCKKADFYGRKKINPVY